MVIGLPAIGRLAARSALRHREGDEASQLTGGLVDGPVYRSIYRNLYGSVCTTPDEYAAFNTGFIVYHDDMGDYSTNEPIMDGTANLAYLFSAMARHQD